MIEEKTIWRLRLPCFRLLVPITAVSFSDYLAGEIKEVATIDSLDIRGSKVKQGRVYAYIVLHIEGGYRLILGQLWRVYEDVYIDVTTETLHICRMGISVQNNELWKEQKVINAIVI